ncbi:MAG: SURF1 family protein [Steroidobacterales bacterium]
MLLRLQLGTREFSASWGMAALCLVGVVLFLQLGRWQWHRAAEKRALADDFRRGSERVIELGSRSSAELARYAQVRVSGRYDGAHQFLLDNMSHAGQAGYEVLTPLDLNDGRTLLVDRGWVPLGASRAVLPDVRIPVSPDSAERAVSGRLDELPVTGIALGRAPPPLTGPWPRLTSFPRIEELTAALGRRLERRRLLLNGDQPEGYARDWHPSGLTAERHIGYAVQWWALGALAAVLFLSLNLRRRRA